MRILEGVGTFIQLAGLVARLCKMVSRWVCGDTLFADLIPEIEAGALPSVIDTYNSVYIA